MKNPLKQKSEKSRRGFTLLELVVVISVLGILWSIALPNYRASIVQAKEAVLRENLYRLRDLIDQYQSDKGHYPDSLETLVTEGYLRKVPSDPISGEPWTEIPPDPDPSNPDSSLGVYEVKSASSLVGTNGVPYSEW